MIARIVAQDMTASLGQGVVVENRPGANALIGTMEVKRRRADGYTLLITTLSHNVNPILLADKKPYDPSSDFAPGQPGGAAAAGAGHQAATRRSTRCGS